MRASWKAATLAVLSAMTASDGAFVSIGYPAGQSSSLGMVRRGRPMFPSSRSLLAPSSNIFREVDRILEDAFFSSPFDYFFESPLDVKRNYPPSFSGRVNRLLPSADLAVVRRPRPSYKISEDKDKIELVVAVPGSKAGDIEAVVEGNGRVIRLSGISRIEDDGVSIESRFEKAFALGRDGVRLDEDKIEAKMVDSVLTITAPKIVEERKEARSIMITEEKATVAELPAEEKEAEEKESEKKEVTDADPPQDGMKGKKSDDEAKDADLDEDAVIEL